LSHRPRFVPHIRTGRKRGHDEAWRFQPTASVYVISIEPRNPRHRGRVRPSLLVTGPNQSRRITPASPQLHTGVRDCDQVSTKKKQEVVERAQHKLSRTTQRVVAQLQAHPDRSLLVRIGPGRQETCSPLHTRAWRLL